MSRTRLGFSGWRATVLVWSLLIMVVVEARQGAAGGGSGLRRKRKLVSVDLAENLSEPADNMLSRSLTYGKAEKLDKEKKGKKE
eukprot:CAMPEP_0116846932 /NCGR_PEP_ID=MMETSP0418-20121206/14137_1 /TAXON_ID=1158023 /ORGANISM="Astrosyne radiata, Strain 13vi08-1A" /LENGTH=83 /DNA_ID=CAMNT_0004478289 /DNA_START=114 /DNA_END=362 /DNA_ORIENTATION=-